MIITISHTPIGGRSQRLGVLMLASVVPLLTGCGGGSGAAARDTSHVLPTVQVSTAVVTRTPVALEITATGTIVSRAGSFATLGAAAPTRVLRILVSTGEQVRSGQSLLVLDPATFEAASQQATATLRVAREAESRASGLVAQGIWPRRDLEQAHIARVQAEAAATLAQRGLTLSTVRAPMRGVVSRLFAAIGESVDALQPLIEIIDPAAIEVRLALSPNDAARVPAGTVVEFAVDDGSGRATLPFGSGVVTTVAASVDSLTGAVDARARLMTPTRQPRLGEVVSARLQTDIHQNALTVPIVSLVPAGDGYRVFIVSPGDTARARPVTVGRRTGLIAEILNGVVLGETVIAEGAYGVEDGTPVSRTTNAMRDTSAVHNDRARGDSAAGKP